MAINKDYILFVFVYGIYFAILFSMSSKNKLTSKYKEQNELSEFWLKIIGTVFVVLTGGTEIVFRLISSFLSHYRYFFIFFLLCMLFSFLAFILSRSLNSENSKSGKHLDSKNLAAKKSFYNTLGILFFSFAIISFSIMAILEIFAKTSSQT